MNNRLHFIGSFTFSGCAMVMDGGTKMLIGVDGSGSKLEVRLQQHKIPMTNEHWIPGRLHVNGTPINVRSEEESEILNLLDNANIDAPDDSNQSDKKTVQKRIFFGKDIEDFFAANDKGLKFSIEKMLKDIIDFIRSDEYIIISKKFDSA